MGVEIRVAAGLLVVSLHLSHFTPHTSHLARGNRKLYEAFGGQEASFVWRIFLIFLASKFHSRVAQLFKLRTE